MKVGINIKEWYPVYIVNKDTEYADVIVEMSLKEFNKLKH